MKMDLLDDNINIKKFKFYIPYIKTLNEDFEKKALCW